MRVLLTIGGMTVAIALAGCGGPDEPEKKEEPMKVEDTVFGPLVGTPEKVEDRVNSALETRREGLDARIREDEGGSVQEEPAGE